MGVFSRADSPVWWLYLETTKQKERTTYRVGTTTAQRRDSRRLAEDLYHRRMNELGARVHQMPVPRASPLTFTELAATYDRDTIAHHKGKDREREILPRLVAAFGPLPVQAVTKDVVKAWRSVRLTTPTTITTFGSRGSAPPMWLQIHALLKARGPLPLATIKATFGLTTRNVSRTYLRPETAKYFARVRRGVWMAVGRPDRTTKILPPPVARTVNREVDLLKQILASAVPEHLERSPLEGLAPLPVVKRRRRVLQPDDERRLLAVATDPQDYALIVVALDTLTRLGDLLDLKRSDRDGPWIRILDPKAGAPYDVPLSARAARALDRIGHAHAHYFEKFRQAKNPRDWRHAVAKRLRRLCERAGVSYGLATGITFHGATRKTGATRLLVKKGVPVSVVQKLGNWAKPDVLLEDYTAAERDDLLAAVRSHSRSVPGRKRRSA